MIKNAKLKVVSVDNFEQTFGKSDYAMLSCLTESNEELTVGVTHNALKSRGINLSLLDNLVGCTVVATDNTDLNTGIVTSGFDKVQGILDGTAINDNPRSPNFGNPITILLLNRSNCTIQKSDILIAETKDLDSLTQSKVIMEVKKEKALATSKRIQERLAAKLGTTPTAAPKEEVSLEVNEEESPF